jgi:hypothetical protein
MQNAEDTDVTAVPDIKDGEGEPLNQSPPQSPADDRVRFGMPGDPVKGRANAQPKIGLQSGPYLLVPPDGDCQVRLGRAFNDNA